LTEESKQEILSKTCDDNFYNELPHTFILLDDAINILTQKKYKKLQQLLFRNTQPRFTICICVQDLTGVPPQVRRNLDSLWLFGGNVSRQNFIYLLNQCYLDVKDKKEIIWDNYNKLSVNEILLFTYDRDRPKSKFSKPSPFRRLFLIFTQDGTAVPVAPQVLYIGQRVVRHLEVLYTGSVRVLFGIVSLERYVKRCGILEEERGIYLYLLIGNGFYWANV
jgi:hypothetical protein